MAIARRWLSSVGKGRKTRWKRDEALKDTFQPSHLNHEQRRQSRVVIVHESNRLAAVKIKQSRSRLGCDCRTIKTPRDAQEIY